ncbi:MAG: serine hydrolase [Bacteroidota bacterium]
MKKLGIYLAGSIMLLFAVACSSTKDKGQQSFIAAPQVLDSILDKHIDDGYYPFVYARLEDLEGNVLYEHGKVNQSLVPNRVLDGDTWFRIWSMSKIVTISVALDLIEEGVLQFNTPVSKYIPAFDQLQVAETLTGSSLTDLEWDKKATACPFQLVPMDSVMTVLHLINHQAGFYYATTGIPCLDSLLADQNLPTATDTDDFLQRVAQLPLIQQPGSNYFYGINTTILGMVAERATGKSLQQLVEERITGPMQIEGLQYGLANPAVLLPSFSGKDSILRQARSGELDIFGPDVPSYAPTKELYLGGEGMVGTADGYADFVRMLLKRGTLNGHRLLNPATVEDIYAPHTQLDNPYGYNGYNLWISGDTLRAQGYGEAGLWIGGGYESTHFWADDKHHFVGVILSQANFVQAPGYEMMDKFRGEIYRQIWAREE